MPRARSSALVKAAEAAARTIAADASLITKTGGAVGAKREDVTSENKKDASRILLRKGPMRISPSSNEPSDSLFEKTQPELKTSLTDALSRRRLPASTNDSSSLRASSSTLTQTRASIVKGELGYGRQASKEQSPKDERQKSKVERQTSNDERDDSGEPLFVTCANGLKASVLRLDKQFIVVNKPNGILSQPDATGDESLNESVADFLKDHYRKPGNAYVGVVHRLDRPASGVVVLPTTSKAASRLAEQIRKRTFKKDYLAVVPKRHLRNKTDGVVLGTGDEEGDLYWKEVFQVENSYAILHIKIDSGKKHQIRRQLAHAGIGPIVGDMRYHSTFRAPRDFPPSKGIMLHASRISFAHPTRPDEHVTVSCPPPWPKEFIPMFYRDRDESNHHRKRRTTRSNK